MATPSLHAPNRPSLAPTSARFAPSAIQSPPHPLFPFFLFLLGPSRAGALPSAPQPSRAAILRFLPQEAASTPPSPSPPLTRLIPTVSGWNRPLHRRAPLELHRSSAPTPASIFGRPSSPFNALNGFVAKISLKAEIIREPLPENGDFVRGGLFS
ncbi:hypothetical protein C2845_PM11G03200 [Panicum miliaceum]|uniref:Uncharacterized protein n=1 Tax=Panicum miliaceum TaxID=4540 RepID=A0A3L6RVW3_PANMI|nr:hypothetical protein C2845_PM11G03200 [Panicum miliaceum]